MLNNWDEIWWTGWFNWNQPWVGVTWFQVWSPLNPRLNFKSNPSYFPGSLALELKFGETVLLPLFKAGSPPSIQDTLEILFFLFLLSCMKQFQGVVKLYYRSFLVQSSPHRCFVGLNSKHAWKNSRSSLRSAVALEFAS